MRPHVAISYFETYKSYDNMPKSRPTFKTITEMLKFEKIQKCPNSLIFSQSVSLTQYVVLSVRPSACLSVCLFQLAYCLNDQAHIA